MRYLKIFENFNPYDDEPLTKAEEIFGKKTRLEKQFSNIIVDGLGSDDDRVLLFWSTFNALKIEIQDLIDEDSNDYKEFIHRIVEGENPVVVANDICERLPKNLEIKRLLNKLNTI